MKEINCRKNKILIGAIELAFEKFENGRGNRSWTNSEDWFVPLAKRFPGLPKISVQRQKIKPKRIIH